jgi:hypothetical protein
MRSVGLFAAVLIAAMAASLCPAFAQNAAWLGRGGAGLAMTNEDATAYVNPAGLARLTDNGFTTNASDNWVGQLGYMSDSNGNAMDIWAVQASMRRLNENWGLGAGYTYWDGDKSWFAGFGQGFSKKADKGFAWGVLLSQNKFIEPVYPTVLGVHTVSRVTVDLGLQYQNQIDLLGFPGTWSFGATCVDVADEFQRYYNAGLAFQTGRAKLAVDLIDLNDDTWDGRTTNFGGEYKLCKYLTGRVGSLDSNLTWGASAQYNRLALDFGTMQGEEDDDIDVKVFGIRYGSSW